jgi:adenylate cyclase
MKFCPTCQHLYRDESINFCLHDGTPLARHERSQLTPTIVVPVDRSPEIATQLKNVPPSVAVLPFTNMSADPENEYFCDGLAEELSNALAKIEELKVAARTSAFTFKNKNIDISEIARILNVNTILEGSVRKAGNRVRITVQLINASDGYHLWSERYDREMKDIFDVQDEIALAVVDALKVRLLGGEKDAVLKHNTDNSEAYELYLRGRFFWNKRTPAAFAKAIENFDRAINLDSDYALAHSGLADCHTFLGYYESFSPRKVAPKAKAAASKALDLDDTIAEPHASVGVYKWFYEFDLAECERQFKRAIEINPSYTSTHHWYSSALAAQGRFDEAIREAEVSLKLEPLTPIVNANNARNFYIARRYDEAIKLSLKTLELAPDFFFARWTLGICYAQTGLLEQAIESLEKAITSHDVSHMKADLGRVLAESGRTAEARRLLQEFHERASHSYVSPVNLARIHVGLNETDAALDAIEHGCDDRSIALIWLGVDPAFDKLRGEQRFQEVLKKTGLQKSIAKESSYRG